MTIEKVYFQDEKIFAVIDGKEHNLPLKVFPRLLHATKEEREDFRIWNNHESIRWDSIDEDVYVSSFFHEGVSVNRNCCMKNKV